MRYMLDTDTVSYAIREDGRVGATILRHARSALCVSAVTVAELRFGADRRRSRTLDRLIDEFLRETDVMPFDRECGVIFGKIAADLAFRGLAIGVFDTMIAAHALAIDATLVTNNLKHFSRVRSLRAESWL